MTQRGRTWVVAAAVVTMCAGVILAGAGEAQARAEASASHPFERVWPAALRFLRIDAGFRILEKDAEAGYILFEVKEDGKRFQGALEVVRTEDAEERPAVDLVLRIEDRPSYMERVILERLERKLRDELGEPPPPPPKKEE